MRTQKQELLLFFIIVLVLCFPSVSLANTTKSQVGIFFTEGNEADELLQEKKSNGKKNPSIGAKEVQRGDYLPQTGEQGQENILIVGSLLLVISVVGMNKIKRG